MLWMAKSKTHGCDAHSSRCTQLLIGTTLAVEHNRETVFLVIQSQGVAQSNQGFKGRALSSGRGQRAREGVGRTTDGTVSITDVR